MLERIEGFVHGGAPLPHAAGQGVPHEDQPHPEQDLHSLAHEHVPDAEDARPRKSSESGKSSLNLEQISFY